MLETKAMLQDDKSDVKIEFHYNPGVRYEDPDTGKANFWPRVIMTVAGSRYYLTPSDLYRAVDAVTPFYDRK
jgi:hypothetical protein